LRDADRADREGPRSVREIAKDASAANPPQ